MSDQVTITALQAERFKCLKAVYYKLSPAGLTVIGGRNGQGKTANLDAICFALGGDRFKPTDIHNRDADGYAYIHLDLSNGLVVERKGKNASLHVTAPDGLKGNQTLLNAFVETFALDLPKFMQSSATAKADTLLKIIGAGDELTRLDNLIAKVYDERRTAGKIADEAEAKVPEALPHPNAPQEAVSLSDLLNNIEIANKAARELDELQEAEQRQDEAIATATQQIEDLRRAIKIEEEKIERSKTRRSSIQAAITEHVVPDVEVLKTTLALAEETNKEIAENDVYHAAKAEAETKRAEHTAMDETIAGLRKEREAFLDGVNMPLPGLTIVDGELVYRGDRWDGMSGSDQLKVATSIVKELNPDCGFVLLDKLEQMDLESLTEFGEWAASEGLQIIATRVSTGKECSLVIEDGRARVGSDCEVSE